MLIGRLPLKLGHGLPWVLFIWRGLTRLWEEVCNTMHEALVQSIQLQLRTNWYFFSSQHYLFYRQLMLIIKKNTFLRNKITQWEQRTWSQHFSQYGKLSKQPVICSEHFNVLWDIILWSLFIVVMLYSLKFNFIVIWLIVLL